MLRIVAISRRLLPWVLLISGVLSMRVAAQKVARHDPVLMDWPQFGSDAASSSAPAASTGITAANVGVSRPATSPPEWDR